MAGNRLTNPTSSRLTCTCADGEANSLLGAVEGHVEALHHGGANHQAVNRRGDAESETVQRAAHVCDWLNVELQRAN